MDKPHIRLHSDGGHKFKVVVIVPRLHEPNRPHRYGLHFWVSGSNVALAYAYAMIQFIQRETQ